jgi:tRNA pseudouridine32 synthase/23S rRNA pseudouridine746 synthase
MARPPKNPLIPLRDGVSPSCVALPRMKHSPWATVLDHLAERLPAASRDDWWRRMACGTVLGEDGLAMPPETPYAHGARVYYWRDLPEEPPIPYEASIVFQDDWLVVADKPHFLPVTPGGRYLKETLLVRLKAQLGCPELSPLHRIDRETAGLMVLSKRPQDRHAYQLLFRQRRVHKYYEAVAAAPTALATPPAWALVRRSRIEEDPAQFFRMREVDGEPNSETRIRLLKIHEGRALYGLEPVSGKRHQLRVHMNALGLPLQGDQFYPSVRRGPDEPEDFSDPLQLLARAIAFTDPVTGEARAFRSSRVLSGWD